MTYTIYDFVGNVGVFFIIVSYLMLQLNIISIANIKYSLMNLMGALLVIISLISNFNMSAFIIEAFWAAISLIGIVKYFKNTSLSKNG